MKTSANEGSLLRYKLTGYLAGLNSACQDGDAPSAGRLSQLALLALDQVGGACPVDEELAKQIGARALNRLWISEASSILGTRSLLIELKELSKTLDFSTLGLDEWLPEIVDSLGSGDSGHSILVSDREGVLQAASPGFELLSGYKEHEVIGRTCAFMQGEKTDPKVVEKLREALVNGSGFDGMILNYRKNLTMFWNKLTIMPLKRDGEVKGFVSMSVDATEIKRKEAEIDLLKMAVANINDIVLITEAEPIGAPGPKIIYVNEAFERRTGYASHEVLGKTPRILQGPKTDIAELARIRNALEKWNPVRAELINYDKSGKEFWLELDITPIADQSGFFTHWVAVERDITQRKEQELLFKSTQERFWSIIETEPQCVKVLDQNGALVLMNAAGISMCEAENFEQVRDPGFLSFVEKSDRPAMMGIFNKVWAGHSGGRMSFTAHGLKGAIRRLSTVISPLRSADGASWHALAITEDVTEEERAKAELAEMHVNLEAKVSERTSQLARAHTDLVKANQTLSLAQDKLVEHEKLSALGGMVSGLSHELNTPLGNALLMSTTMGDRVRDFEKRLDSGEKPLSRSELRSALSQLAECAQVFTLNVEKAAKLVKSFKQVAVDRVGEARRVFKLADLARDVGMTMSPTIKAAKCALEVEVEKGLELDGYPGKLGQVLSNLIENSIIHGFEDFNYSDGPPTIRIKGRTMDNGEVELIVSDNGRGVDPRNKRKVFDPFFSTKSGRGGTGLGLHIVRSIVMGVLGGSLQLDDNDGRGAKLVIILPKSVPLGPYSQKK